MFDCLLYLRIMVLCILLMVLCICFVYNSWIPVCLKLVGLFRDIFFSSFSCCYCWSYTWNCSSENSWYCFSPLVNSTAFPAVIPTNCPHFLCCAHQDSETRIPGTIRMYFIFYYQYFLLSPIALYWRVKSPHR